MKKRIAALLVRLLSPALRPIKGVLDVLSMRTAGPEAQLQLMQSYRMTAALCPERLPGIENVGLRKFSQCDEDGILLYIFALIGTRSKKAVEVCAADGIQSNSANLILNHGWWGYLFDGDENKVRRGREFFASNRDTRHLPPVFQQAWVTAENINGLLAQAGLEGEVDLFSLDIDGMDYWVWKAMDQIDPRVVVCEVHNPIPKELAVTAPYDPQFICGDENFRGASLAAMIKLGNEKGYRLVGMHQYGFNAFFVKRGIGEDVLPEVSIQECQNDLFSKKARLERWPLVKDREWVSV